MLRSAGSSSGVIRVRKSNSSCDWSDLILLVPLLVMLIYFGWLYNLQLSKRKILIVQYEEPLISGVTQSEWRCYEFLPMSYYVLREK